MVHWKGASSGEDTWEEAAALGQDEWLVSEWEHDQASAAQQPAPQQTAEQAADKDDKADAQDKQEGGESVPPDNEEWHVQGHEW